MSADAGSAAPSDGGADAPAGEIAPHVPSDFGTRADIQDALNFHGIEDLAPDERPAEDEPGDELAAKRDEKGQFKAADAKDKPPADDDDVATVKAIEARAKARRAARAEARRASARPAPAAAAPAKTPEPPLVAAAPAAARAPTPVETAVRDVLAQIDRLATGDAEAAAADGGAPAPDTAARKAALDAVNAKLDELKKGLEETAEGKAQMTALQEQVRALESDRIVRKHITKAVNAVADELPTLTDPKAIRAFNKEHGTEFADAVEMIGEAAGRYYEKFKRAPDLALLARKIESKLKGASPEKTPEKPIPPSKTVSRNDGSPPAARTTSDDRTYEETIAEFNRRFGLE